MGKLKRLVKLEGFGNVQMTEDDVPSPAPDEVQAQPGQPRLGAVSTLRARRGGARSDDLAFAARASGGTRTGPGTLGDRSPNASVLVDHVAPFSG